MTRLPARYVLYIYPSSLWPGSSANPTSVCSTKVTSSPINRQFMYWPMNRYHSHHPGFSSCPLKSSTQSSLISQHQIWPVPQQLAGLSSIMDPAICYGLASSTQDFPPLLRIQVFSKPSVVYILRTIHAGSYRSTRSGLRTVRIRDP